MKKIFIIVLLTFFPGLVMASTLSVSPSSQSLKVGDTFTVNINLDTQGKMIDGVDIRYLNYNPNIIQIQDSGIEAGVQIAPGNLMPLTLVNKVDESLGRVTFSQVVAGGSKYTGSGVLATITFKAVAPGNTDLTFDYSPNSTTDSNIASGGLDVLSLVVNGNYSVNSLTSSSGTVSSSGGGGSSSAGSGGSSVVGSATGIYYTTPIVFSSAQIVRNLFRGAEGEDVRVLQSFLVNNGYMTPDNITGFFGPITENAVKRFQSDQGIVSSGTALSTGYGFVGPTTKAKINQLLANTTGSVASNAKSLSPQAVAAIKAQIALLQEQVLQLLKKLQAMQASNR